MDWKDVQAEANEIFNYVECMNGRWFLVQNTPEEVREIALKIHADMLPDDYKYEFLVKGLEAIIGSPDEDSVWEWEYSEVMDWELLQWVSSDLTRAFYVDEAVEEMGYNTLSKALAGGYHREKEEVMGLLLYNLNSRVVEKLAAMQYRICSPR
mgnify:CR=1 FL=1